MPFQTNLDGQFKTIIGCKCSACLCLSTKDELYLLELHDLNTVLSNVSDDVKSVSCGITEKRKLIIYYVTKGGERCGYSPSIWYKTQSIMKPGLELDYCPLTLVYEQVKLINRDVRSVTMLYNYLLIVDKQDEL